MARGLVTPYVVDRTGLDLSTLTPTTGDVTNGHYVPNNGVMWVDVKNTNAGSTAHIVTFKLTGSSDGQAYTSKTKSIAAGKTFRMGPWPAGSYGSQLNIDVDHAELTVTAFVLSL